MGIADLVKQHRYIIETDFVVCGEAWNRFNIKAVFPDIVIPIIEMILKFLRSEKIAKQPDVTYCILQLFISFSVM